MAAPVWQEAMLVVSGISSPLKAAGSLRFQIRLEKLHVEI